MSSNENLYLYILKCVFQVTKSKNRRNHFAKHLPGTSRVIEKKPGIENLILCLYSGLRKNSRPEGPTCFPRHSQWVCFKRILSILLFSEEFLNFLFLRGTILHPSTLSQPELASYKYAWSPHVEVETGIVHNRLISFAIPFFKGLFRESTKEVSKFET